MESNGTDCNLTDKHREPSCEWSKGGAKRAFVKKRFAATCGDERNAMERSVTKVGYLTAVG